MGFCGFAERQGEIGRGQQICRTKSQNAGATKVTFLASLLGRQSGPIERGNGQSLQRREPGGNA